MNELVFMFAAHELERRPVVRHAPDGLVRNRREGTVEVVAEGERAKVEELIGWCRGGPPHARVTGVDVSWEEPTGEFEGFKVAYTA